MCTPDGILSLFENLADCGIQPPSSLDIDRAAVLWAAVLADVPDELLAVAAVRYATRRADDGRSHRFWPTPADIRELLGLGELLAHGGQVSPLRRLDPDGAWGLLLRLVSKHGHPDPPQIGDEPEPEYRLEPVPGNNALRRVRGAGRPRWRLHEDPSLCAAIEAGLLAVGGWNALCRREENDPAAAASFRRAYQTHLERASQAGDTSALLERLGAAGIGAPPRRLTLDVLPGGRSS